MQAALALPPSALRSIHPRDLLEAKRARAAEHWHGIVLLCPAAWRALCRARRAQDALDWATTAEGRAAVHEASTEAWGAFREVEQADPACRAARAALDAATLELERFDAEGS